MDKFIIDFDRLKTLERVGEGATSNLFKISENEALKIYKESFFSESEKILLERRLDLAEKYRVYKSIAIPTRKVYDSNNCFMGAQIPFVEGINFMDFVNLLNCDNDISLEDYANIYNAIEKKVKEPGDDIIFSDLASFSNIIVDENCNFIFIDYDGLQIDGIPSLTYAGNLGKIDKRFVSWHNPRIFNKNIDKKSLVHLYFWMVFGITLEPVGEPIGKINLSIQHVFDILNFQDDSITDRIRSVFELDRDPEFLGDVVYQIAENYQLGVRETKNRRKAKILIKK